jgi:FkbM family methyltransferase
VANSLFRRLWKPKPQYAQIGRHRIRLAVDSRWPHYRKKFQLYDAALGPIAAVVHAKYPALHAIDIGANVGDTAALIRESAEIPILCIEGDPVLLPILAENAARLGPDVVIEPSFVGPEGAAVNLQSATDLGRNASLVNAADSRGPIKLRTLAAILADHPEFRSAKLLKTDTEGFDFDILRQSLDFIEQSKPLIHFEYDPHFHPDQPRAGLDAIAALIATGYSDFIYYDNFGNLLLHATAANTTLFADLDSYLASNQRHGIAVYYFDVCAIHREDASLAAAIKAATQR